MARFNTQSITTSVTGAGTVASPQAFTALNGTAPYTVTLPSPVLFPGSSQTFYNATAGTVTISTPSGLFGGLGASGAGTLAIPTNTVVSVTSDGVNYIVLSEDGSALVATTGSFTGNVTANGATATVSLTPQTVTIAPTGASTIDNINIGVSTRGSGAFNTLTANSAVTLTANTTSSSTGSGSLVVTGGVGVSGAVYAAGLYGPLTGTVQTAAQPNITSTGSLTIPGLTVSQSSGAGGIAIGTNAGQALYQYINFGGGNGGVDYAWQIGRSPSGGVGPTDGFYFYDIKANATRLSINGSGNVGIGTANQSWPLTVKSGSSGTVATFLYDGAFAGTGEANIGLRWYNGGNANDIPQVKLRGYGTSNYTGNFGIDVLVGGTYPNGFAERFTIQGTTGNVGIGTTSPESRLHVVYPYAKTDTTERVVSTWSSNDAGGFNQLYMTATGHASAQASRIWRLQTSLSGTGDAGILSLQSGGGNVGIGSTGPQTLLELATTASINSSNYGQIKHLTLSRSEATRYNAYAGFGDQFGANTFGWRFGTVNNSTDYPTLYMVNGNVGIGTAASPVTRLQANTNTSMASSGSVVEVLSLTDNNGVSNGVTGARIGLTISAQSDITDRRIGIYATANTANFNAPDITFWASGQGIAYRELVRFSAQTGNVGIGYGANPAGKLHVNLTGTANLAAADITNMTAFGASSRMGFSGLANNSDGIYFGMGIDGGINAGMGFFREAGGWNSALTFYTNNATDGVNVSRMQEKMRINSNGNVGIGTNSPTGKLHISLQNSDSATTGINVISTASVYPGTQNFIAGKFINNHFGDSWGLWVEANNGSYGACTGIYAKGSIVGATASGVHGYCEHTNPGGYGVAVGGQFVAHGNLAGGATNGTMIGVIAKCTSVATSVVGHASYGIRLETNPGPVSSYGGVYIHNGSQMFVLNSNGGISNYSGNNLNLSDQREKRNIVLAGDYLSKICAIPIKTFNYNNDAEGEQVTLGVIAQEVEPIAPELVSESEWEYGSETNADGAPISLKRTRKGIYETDMMFAIMKSVQELNAKHEALKLEFDAYKTAHP